MLSKVSPVLLPLGITLLSNQRGGILGDGGVLLPLGITLLSNTLDLAAPTDNVLLPLGITLLSNPPRGTSTK